MALVNDVKKEINAKIVYIGPKGAGKGTALRQIYSKLKPEQRSELKSMAVGQDQMIFFDFSYPRSVDAQCYSVRFHVYTFLGGEGTAPPWKMLLKGVDGVVLFADSTDGRMYANLESCTVLLDSLAHYGKKLADVALSLQCNKRDLRGALPLDSMGSELLPGLDAAPTAVTASTGEGLLEGLNGLASRILVTLGQESTFATEDVPSQIEERAVAPEEAFDHCSADVPGFSVETSGDPVAIDPATIVIPLRINGGACGKSVALKVTVSLGV
jgi:signal recognition particle receptor subunit beta